MVNWIFTFLDAHKGFGQMVGGDAFGGRRAKENGGRNNGIDGWKALFDR